MKILITGSTGFIGKNILEFLSKQHKVHTLGKKNCDYNLDLINLQDYNFNEQFDLVIHIAGKAHTVERNPNIINSFYNVNVLGTQNLINNFIKYGIPKKLIYISSVSVYGVLEGENIDENTPLNADDAYGKSKILAEGLIYDWGIKYNVITTIFRLPLVVADNPPGNLGAMINSIKKGFYFNIQGGKARKSMVLVSDLVNILVTASEKGGIYNLTDGYHPSFFELSNLISKQLGKNKLLNLNIHLAKLIASVGDILGDYVPLNSIKLKKITSTLTFDDTKARKYINWKSTSILDNFNINKDY